ncbi:MAG: DUF58 domain-containing protein [Gemmataceae bacterium]
MLTTRGGWVLVSAFLLVCLSLFAQLPSLAFIGLTLLVWFFWNQLAFQLKFHWQRNKFQLHLEVQDELGPVQSLWAGKHFRVFVSLSSKSRLPSTYLRMTARLPYHGVGPKVAPTTQGVTRRGRSLDITYTIVCVSPGTVRFEGVEIQCADLHGFFYTRLFLRCPKLYSVLPGVYAASNHSPLLKRENLLPLLGAHRHPRPGSGSELLDLRDYIAGDPPKTIAWKVSARRDRLITKEFESEVPLQCTFFVDVSNSVRVGSPGRNALTRVVEITAAVSQATSAVRDMPGLCVFDGEKVLSYLRPTRGTKHLVQIMHELAKVAQLPPTSPQLHETDLLALGYSFASEVYPDMLTDEINSFPWWLPWWAPRPPAATRNKRETSGRRLSGALWRLSWYASGGVAVGVVLGILIFVGIPALFREISENLLAFLPVQPFVIAFLPIFNILGLLAWGMGTWLGQGFLRRLLTTGRAEWRRYKRRKQLSALLAFHYQLGPGGIGWLMEDQTAFAHYTQQFLGEHHVPYQPPLYSENGQYLFAAPEKIEKLTQALLRAIARGKDNELFVLVVDLLELEDHLEPLLKAVKVALARHHEVVVVCPWPPRIPLPKSKRSKIEREDELLDLLTISNVRRLIHEAAGLRMQKAYERLRQRFGKLGVSVVCAAHDDSVRLVVDKLDRLRRQFQGLR